MMPRTLEPNCDKTHRKDKGNKEKQKEKRKKGKMLFDWLSVKIQNGLKREGKNGGQAAEEVDMASDLNKARPDGKEDDRRGMNATGDFGLLVCAP